MKNLLAEVIKHELVDSLETVARIIAITLARLPEDKREAELKDMTEALIRDMSDNVTNIFFPAYLECQERLKLPGADAIACAEEFHRRCSELRKVYIDKREAERANIN